MIRRLLLRSLALSSPALPGAVACSKTSCEDTGTCGGCDGAQPWCDGVFRNDDGTVCNTCPTRGDNGIWLWPDGQQWDESEASQILCDDAGTAGGSAGATGTDGIQAETLLVE